MFKLMIITMIVINQSLLNATTLNESLNIIVLNNSSIILIILLTFSFIIIGAGMFSSSYALCLSLSAYAACDPKYRGAAFIPAVMPGSQGLYSFAITFMMIQNIFDKPIEVIFAGILCGLPCLISAFGQAEVASSCIKSINNGEMNLGQALLATGIPELYALTGLASAFLIMT